jgi:hypothetical protein
MYRITDDVVWTDENIDDIVLGSGATAYEWWLDLEQADGEYIITAEDPEEDGTITVAFTREDFAAACRDAVDGKWTAYMTGTGATAADYIRKDDLDADAVDCIFQMIVWKELVYG